MSKIVFSGTMFQIKQWEGRPGIIFETAKRAPGVRIIAEIVKDTTKHIILTQEKRREVDGYDYRLPGGKVFDSFKEYNEFQGDIGVVAIEKAKAEAKEEAGITSEDWQLLGISKAGASVDWDLYYFLAQDISLGERELEEGEKDSFGETLVVSPHKLFNLLSEGKIQEGRSAAYLWDWLAKNNYLKIK